MKMESNLSTKKITKTQRPKTTKAINPKLSGFSKLIGVVVLLGATAPFWHIWFDQNSENKFLGFKNLSVFLSAFGTYFAFFCASSFFFWIKNFIDPQYKDVIKIINIIGGVFVSISVYFLLWVFNPHSDFPSYVYHIVFVIIAVLIAYAMYLLNNFVARVSFNKLQNMRNLIGFIVRTRDKHYQRVAVKALYAEKHKKPMSSKDTVADNANEFEEDFYDTLEKVDTYN